MTSAAYVEWDEEDAFDTDDERPLRRARRRPVRWLRLTLMVSLCIAGLTYFAQQTSQETRKADPRSVPPAVLIAPAPLWRPVSPSPAVYALEGGQGAVALQARQHTSGAREDTLTLGRFGDPLHARITLVQSFSEPAGSLYVDMVRRSAEAGLSVVRSGLSRLIPTKFGSVETASMTLAGAGEKECRAFRFSDPDAGFGFHGWLCGGDPSAIDEAQIVCLINGISLASGASPSLKAVFVQAERNRTGACGPGALTAAAEIRPPRRP